MTDNMGLTNSDAILQLLRQQSEAIQSALLELKAAVAELKPAKPAEPWKPAYTPLENLRFDVDQLQRAESEHWHSNFKQIMNLQDQINLLSKQLNKFHERLQKLEYPDLPPLEGGSRPFKPHESN